MEADAPGINEIEAQARSLREKTALLRSQQSRGETVRQIARWSEAWQDPHFKYRIRARSIDGHFPYKMVEGNLDSLLASLNESDLFALLDEDGVADIDGYLLVGHVAAGNTPLLVWTSVLRALLVHSASFVKLSSSDDCRWTELFVESLLDLCPLLASCIELRRWPGEDVDLNGAFCTAVDLVVAYGSDATITSLRRITPTSTSFLGYGHRISIGIAGEGVREDDVSGFARDILVYDQRGCLSPQIIFVLGSMDDFCGRLSRSLERCAESIPSGTRDAESATRVRTHRQLARMARCRVIESMSLRWTIVAEGRGQIEPPCRHGIVHLRPAAGLAEIMQCLSPYRGIVQGCALAPWTTFEQSEPAVSELLVELGCSLICPAGELQRPPFSWKQDNFRVLRSLTRYNDCIDLAERS